MVRVRSIEGVLITAESYKELIKAVSNEVDNYEGYQPKLTFVDGTRAIIYHDEIPEEIPFDEEPWAGRWCCECGHYDWGRGCPYKEGHVTLKMDACHHFTVEIEGSDM